MGAVMRWDADPRLEGTGLQVIEVNRPSRLGSTPKLPKSKYAEAPRYVEHRNRAALDLPFSRRRLEVDGPSAVGQLVGVGVSDPNYRARRLDHDPPTDDQSGEEFELSPEQLRALADRGVR